MTQNIFATSNGIGCSQRGKLTESSLIRLHPIRGVRTAVFQERGNQMRLLKFETAFTYKHNLFLTKNPNAADTFVYNHFFARQLASEFRDWMTSTSWSILWFSLDVRSSQTAFQPCRRGPQKSFSMQSPVIQMGSLTSRPNCC